MSRTAVFMFLLSASAAIMLVFCPRFCAGEVSYPQAETLFAQGVESYEAGDFPNALGKFREILQELPFNQRSSSAQLMLAKTLYKLGQYGQAIRAAEDLLEVYPGSQYSPHAVYVIAACRFRQGRYTDAINEYAKVTKSNADSTLKRRARNIIDRIAETKLSPADIEQLQSEALVEPPARKVDLVSVMLSSIGLLCPISGPDSTLGQDMLDGARLAFWDAKDSFGVTLMVEDTRSSAIGAVKAAQKLAVQRNILALIGPLFTSPTVAAAAVANCERIPLIAPTANQDSLTTIGDYIFQLNTPPRIQAQRIAEYAVEDLGLSNLAVLAPLNSRGQQMAEGFVRRTEELGARVVVQEWYSNGTTDFGPQLRKIRETGLELLPPDSLQATLTMQDMTDTLAPLSTLEAVFVVGTPAEIALIAPQIAFWRIEAQLLGGSGWNSPELLQLAGDYVNGAIFVAEYFEDNDSPAARRFIDLFRQRYTRNPTKVAAFGYDAACLVVQAWEKGARTRTQLRQALADVTELAGASGEISFREQSNQSAFLLTIRGDTIVKIGVLR